MSDKPRFYERVAQQLIAQLKAGTAPWIRPWAPGASYLPINGATGKAYRGINSLLLASQNRPDPRWLTYKQAEALGAQVRKGEHGTLIQYWKFEERVARREPSAAAEEGSRAEATVQLERPRVFFAVAFNAEQIDGLAALEMKPREWGPNARAAALLERSGARIVHGGEIAAYSPVRDVIRLPQPAQFASESGYYATALHELGHWTGHPSRLDRDLSHRFGSPEYAREELRAEIASLVLGDELGVGHDPAQHAAYVGQWVELLKRDPLEIFRAAAAAEKIRGFVLGLEQQRQELEGEQTQREETTAMTTADHDARSERVYLEVPYADREKARELGARWDRGQRAWYTSEDEGTALLATWPRKTVEPAAEASERTYLAVPYRERQAAKEAGAKWDVQARSWFVGSDVPVERVARWLPERQVVEQSPALTPRDELAVEMRSLGLVVTGEHPVFDGKPHRVPIEGDKRGEKGGFYRAHPDGRPAAYIKNHRTGIERRWKATGHALRQEDLATLRATAAQKLKERTDAQEALYEQTAQRLQRELGSLTAPAAPTPYMTQKGITVHAGVLTDDRGTTFVPATDASGKLWTVAFINAEGRKRFAKSSRKAGCFHVVGGIERLRDAPVLCIAEGYATAATLAELTERPVVAAFDAGNLHAVAEALHAKYPDKPVLIAGDDDRAEEQRSGRNPGRHYAEKAAEAVGGRAVFPVFAPAERELDPKAFSDFNDLTRSVLGRDGAARQFRHVYERAAASRGERAERREHERPRALRAR